MDVTTGAAGGSQSALCLVFCPLGCSLSDLRTTLYSLLSVLRSSTGLFGRNEDLLLKVKAHSDLSLAHAHPWLWYECESVCLRSHCSSERQAHPCNSSARVSSGLQTPKMEDGLSIRSA